MPGVFGVPVRSWVKGVVHDGGGSAPLGLPPDRYAFAFNTSTTNGVYPAGVSRQSASSPQQLPTTLMDLFVRKTGSDNNGGSSNGTAPDRTGTDGVTNATTTFTAASGAFTSADVNKLINIVGKGRYRIVGFTNGTTVTLSGSPSAGSGLTWNLGGAVLTIGALLANANAAVLGGDRIWIGAGTYREIVTVAVTPTFDLRIEGDVDGKMTGDSGDVIWTAFTTDDRTLPAIRLIDLNNNISNLTFRSLVLVGGTDASQSIVRATGGGLSQYVRWEKCTFICGANGRMLTVTSVAGFPLLWSFDSCIFQQGTGPVVNGTLAATADFDLAVVFTNCRLGTVVNVNATGTGAGRPGGVTVAGCTLITAGNFFPVSANFSTSIPVAVRYCYLWGSANTCFQATTYGQIVEDYNYLYGFSANRSNVPVGPHSGLAAPLLELGQDVFTGRAARPWGQPTAGGPLLGLGSSLGRDLTGGPRPAGGASPSSAIGAFERGNTWGREVGTVRTGLNALSITGPGFEDLNLPVDAVPMTVSVYMRYDSTYAGRKPQLQIVNGYECGVPDQISLPVSTVDTWEQLSVTFTPSAQGIVTIRLLSSDTNGGGKAFADDLLVTTP